MTPAFPASRAATTTARAVRDVAARLVAALILLTLVGAPALLPRAAAGEPGTTQFLKISIDGVTPEIVDTAGGPLVTVTGRVANVGDRSVRDVVVRLEHADAVAASAGLRTSLAGAGDQYQPVADFITVAPELNQGESVPFTLAYPLRSNAGPSLRIAEPGVYPLLVNVNGTPDYGAPARLDDARFLLPVLGVPPDPSVEPTDPVSAVVPPDTSRPVQVTMLWPLADRPRLAAGVPGGTTPVRLVDDELATSLAPGGRLDTLLSAADFATSPPVDPDGRVRAATCLAVDPDLLITVNAMTTGYVVVDAPDAGLAGATVPGTGQEAAVNWLGRLKTLAQRMCVTPTVYAQADLTALQRVGDPGLASIATTETADVVDQILGVASVRGATLLGDGPLTGPAVRLLSQREPTVAVAAPQYVAQDSTADDQPDADLAPRRYGPQVVTAPFDPTVGAALAGLGPKPASPSYLDSSLEVPLQHDSQVARRQDALAAMLWRGLRPASEPRTEILMPPVTWDLQPDDAAALLSALGTSIRAGLTAPRPLTAVIAESLATAPAVDDPLPPDALGNPRAQISGAVTGDIASANSRLWGLTSALTTDERTGLTGTQYTAPLREDMLRALSQSVPPDARNGLGEQRVRRAATTIDDLFGAVSIVNPGGSYTLATERSPLPLALRNDLPVPIRVRLDVDAPPGMTVTDMGQIELPPGYLPLRVPIEVHFTQRVAVDVALRTVDGLQLGEPVRLSVHSNAYGKVLFVITLSAGAVLFLLVGRRLWHRFRGEPDNADLDRPKRRDADPDFTPAGARSDPLDVAIAHAPDDE
ncbi:DUF6049 family protein [Mycolicibacterium sediminis]|uniref:Secreted protein n=1 Tax=Mycolicibacterium sediminis TaxID=1286180 RepID=A0A7I7QLM3_9MYCO|nr:DUF6049 family protein [Mycolicibacterium sediminis]BBY27184.1 hypothetical protein MSEDJ_12800 [Mycolicibacterium sediminis]